MSDSEFRKRTITLIALFAALSCALTCGYPFLLMYLETFTPTARLPTAVHLLKHNAWSANGSSWSVDYYSIDMPPEEVKDFYTHSGARCDYYFRKYLSVEEFLYKCDDNAYPYGTFSVEIGQDGEQTLLVIEMAWANELMP